jgi:hypothetical protein
MMSNIMDTHHKNGIKMHDIKNYGIYLCGSVIVNEFEVLERRNKCRL